MSFTRTMQEAACPLDARLAGCRGMARLVLVHNKPDDMLRNCIDNALNNNEDVVR